LRPALRRRACDLADIDCSLLRLATSYVVSACGLGTARQLALVGYATVQSATNDLSRLCTSVDSRGQGSQTTAVDSGSSREQLRDAFAHLDRLVELEGYAATPWLLRIRTALDYLLDVETDDLEAVRRARRIFLDMHAGGRNFSDFFLWREDDAGRRRANQDLENAKSRIWALIENVSHPGP
jgi:hypothetical protein